MKSTIHRFPSTGATYDACQCDPSVRKGDILWIPSETVVGIADTWPIAITHANGALHYVDDSPAGLIYFASNDEMAAGKDGAIELALALGYPIMAHLLPPPPRTNNDDWVSACGGTEVPFVINGRRLHYLWNRNTGEHAYYDCAADIILSTNEALAIFDKR